MSEEENPHAPPNEDIIDGLNRDNEAYIQALQHFKLFLMVKQHEIATEILKLESSINDPKTLFRNGK